MTVRSFESDGIHAGRPAQHHCTCPLGYVAAKSRESGPPSEIPMIAALSIPVASITARMSSMRSSSSAAPAIASDTPSPRLSNVATRAKVPNRSMKSAYRSKVKSRSRWERAGTMTMFRGPAPNTR